MLRNHDKITASTLILLHDLSTGKLKPSCLRMICYIPLYPTKRKTRTMPEIQEFEVCTKQPQGYLELVGNTFIIS